jgi:hypothetical protein
MVTITNCIERQKSDGSNFTVLEISSGIEVIQSSTSGKFYISSKRTTLPCTFSFQFAQSLIGTQMPGNVVRIQVPAYDYINPRTNETMKLQHAFSYQPEGSMELIGETRITELEMA